MEIVDELMTPGCPQCAVKHLSAALFHVAQGNLVKFDASFAHDSCVHVGIALINLAETFAGYESHLWYAVGALVRAEEYAYTAPGFGGSVAESAREARLLLEMDGLDAARDAMLHLQDSVVLTHAEWALAHYLEAVRELPDFQAEMRMDDLAGSIERIRKEFFTSDTTAPAAATAEGGGESDMAKAAKKAPAFLKKGDGKAAQAACKGGKCKGKKCK